MRLIFLLSLSLLSLVQGYHILCVFPVPTRSHNTLGKGIVDALLKGGHEVTWATPYPPKDPKKGLNIIDVSVTVPIFATLDMLKNVKLGFSGLKLAKSYARNVTMTALTPILRDKLINEQYDAVVTEMFFSEIDAGYAAVQGIPWIVLSGSSLAPSLEALVDSVNSVPTLPSMFIDYPLPLNFWQRLLNVVFLGGTKVMAWMDEEKNVEDYNTMFAPIAKARGVELTPFVDALYNVSIMFVNTHPSFVIAQSLPPNVVHIGGYHIDENIPPLPKDLQDLLDASPQGVVYFSMGSVLKSASFPEHTRRGILKVFGELPYTVLWKFEEQLDGLPKNVHIRKWMPQASILAHPNVKLFITHGGMLSNLETLHHGVPLISIPLYGDQPANANRAVRAGYAVRVEYDVDTMADQLRPALKEALGTDRYYKRAKYLSTLFRKRPAPPSKYIAHYVEEAIISKGAYHLRSKALIYPWYQRTMLDIAAFILFILLVLYFILKKLINSILNIFKGSPKKTESKKKVKKN